MALRQAVAHPSKESLAHVLNWQFVFSLKLWAKFLADGMATKTAGSCALLVFPLTQVFIFVPFTCTEQSTYLFFSIV